MKPAHKAGLCILNAGGIFFLTLYLFFGLEYALGQSFYIAVLIPTLLIWGGVLLYHWLGDKHI